jgi:DNA-binding PadR family transcriptional regulator
MAKFYSLTASGHTQLAEEMDQWQRYARAIQWVLQAGEVAS